MIYNVGLLATPWFEGRLAQCLADILGGNETAAQMAVLVLAYIAVTLLVQAARGDVALSHVTFGYGEKPVLEDFSLTVKQGEQVMLVGRTGAGKRPSSSPPWRTRRWTRRWRPTRCSGK